MRTSKVDQSFTRAILYNNVGAPMERLAIDILGPLSIKRINDLVYRVQLTPRSKTKVIYRNRLWQYTGSSPPTWLMGQDDPVMEAEPR